VVTEGKVLATVGAGDAQAALLQAQANLENANATLSQLLQGARVEELAVKQQAVDNAMNALDQVYVTVPDVIRDTDATTADVVMCDDLKDLLQTIKIPNVFTPNGDGRNEFFEIKNLSQFLGNKLTIYDRWGGLVYEAVNYNSNWNATGVDPSVYFYQLTVYGMNQPAKTVTGWVEVLGERK
jgi:gliding motility-associated-like protein